MIRARARGGDTGGGGSPVVVERESGMQVGVFLGVTAAANMTAHHTNPQIVRHSARLAAYLLHEQ